MVQLYSICSNGNRVVSGEVNSKLQEEPEVRIRSYDGKKDCTRIGDLERSCVVGPADGASLFTDTLGDPICRIRNSPTYIMLVAELEEELIGVIQGSIKVVAIRNPPWNLAKLGYILGLRVDPTHRRKGVGLTLVHSLEEWFVSNGAEYAYMATEKDNEASTRLFMDRLGYTQFRTPSILVNPVNKCRGLLRISSGIEIKKLGREHALPMYKRCMGSAEFFPDDMDAILENKLSLGTWVAYYKDDPYKDNSTNDDGSRHAPANWAAVSVWNSGELFKLRLGNAPLSYTAYTKISKLMDRFLPCFGVPSIPDFFSPFGFYFIYGIYSEGPMSGMLVRNLCRHVHNMAASSSTSKDCKAVVTEVGDSDKNKVHIPHRKLLSCPEDLWCIKPLKEEGKGNLHRLLAAAPEARSLFVDPREV
ncbi:hypothetical protein SAY86_009117 [Trapa natans]|uniref:N-acetyltransferase domain-containing protein n=1 Tax=Trapa natans TaxID=22666 RepID=A0AAN7KE13_TRANT|nr:hypothetical protein SAY86_009117 [Trapa natans]